MATISFPADLNGITEVGIAAGVDTFTDVAYGITVKYSADNSAPAAPTAAQARAHSFTVQWGNLPDAAARSAAYGTDAIIVGSTGLPSIDIISLIDNWPADDAAAQAQLTITANATTALVTAYDAWILTPVVDRSDVSVDLAATMVSQVPPGSNVVAQRLWQGLVAYIISNGWIVKHEAAGNGLVKYAGPEVTAVRARSEADVNTIGFHGAQECANLLVALKVTWWLINHHVGQKEDTIEGFTGKIAGLQNLVSGTNTAQNREVRKVLWAVGKMVSTRGILHAIGINSIIYHDVSNTGRIEDNDYALGGAITISVSEDVKQRVESAPAGTAKTSTYFAIAKRAAYSIYGVCIPPLTSLSWDSNTKDYTGKAADDLADIQADPANYHMGARFLTGNDRIVVDSWTDEEKANLSAFIHATSTGSTLAKAAVILKQPEIAGNVVYTSINAIRASMTSAIGNRMQTLLINRMSGGGSTGGLARQFGRLSDSDVTAVNRQIELIDMGDVSDDEEPADKESKKVKTDREKRNKLRAERRAARAAAGASS